jgi:hypothetical protein
MKDYFGLESLLRGNHLVKTNWRKQVSTAKELKEDEAKRSQVQFLKPQPG